MAKHNCDWCDQTFDRLNDKMIHYTKLHLGKVDIRRTISCWACAAQIHPDHTHCGQCGWERTQAHIKGTQNV